MRGRVVHSHKNRGNHPRGCWCRNVFSVSNTTWTFGYLSCTDFEHFWNKTWMGVCTRKPVKNFRISAHGVLQVSKTTEYGYFRGVFVIGVL